MREDYQSQRAAEALSGKDGFGGKKNFAGYQEADGGSYGHAKPLMRSLALREPEAYSTLIGAKPHRGHSAGSLLRG